MERFVVLVLGFLMGIFSAQVIPEQQNVPTPLPEREARQEIEALDQTPDAMFESVPNPQVSRYPIVKVVDGDTIVVKKDGENVTLRLIGLDTPETTTTRTGSIECFGDAATEHAKKLLRNTSVTLETDASQDTYDKYGRFLVFVFLPDGSNFAERMILDGYGYEYTYSTAYKYQRAFRAAQTDAKENKRGLWADNVCSPDEPQRKPQQPAAAAVPFTGTYECSKNTYNCSSFKAQSDAQSAFDSCGGAQNDVHKLDSDKDGSVCESLP